MDSTPIRRGWTWTTWPVRAAKSYGVPIVISTDAHNIHGLDALRYGVSASPPRRADQTRRSQHPHPGAIYKSSEPNSLGRTRGGLWAMSGVSRFNAVREGPIRANAIEGGVQCPLYTARTV